MVYWDWFNCSWYPGSYPCPTKEVKRNDGEPGTLSNTKKVYNPSAAVARNCWIGALIGAMIFLYPIVFPISTYGLGYALIFVGIIIFLTGLISGLVFKRVANRLDEMLSGEGLLAYWTYSADEWSRYTEAEHLRDKHDKWMLFRLIDITAYFSGSAIYRQNRLHPGEV
jgi:hypothetical protein